MEDQNFYRETESRESNFDLKKVFYRAIKYWYIVLICFVASIALGIYQYKNTLPLYKVSSLLIINDDNMVKGPSVGSGDDAIPGVNLGNFSNVQNQIVLLTSSDHIKKVIKQLSFTVSYYKKDLLLNEEIYKKSPFIVQPDTVVSPLKTGFFYITFINDKEFLLSLRDNPNSESKHSLFDKITLDDYCFSILPNKKNISKTDYINKEYSFKINPINDLIKEYQEKIFIFPYAKGSSIYEISIHENNTNKGIDFINKLSNSAVQYNLDKKNQIANNTINFIDQQLIGVSDSLSAAENVLENFRSRNEVMDVSMQGQMIIQQSQTLENQKAQILVKLDYYKYLVDYIENNRNLQELMAPSSMGVNDPILTQLITELSSKNAEKSSLQFNSRFENPSITRINRHIETIKNSILENTKSIIATTNLTLDDLNKRLMSLSSQIRKLPKTEQLLLGIERKFKFNDEMYTYLLERRSEAQLAKASNLPDNEIIETAAKRIKVSPDKNKVIIIIIFAGLLFPFAVILSIIFFNNKVQDKDEIEKLTKAPIIGVIPVNQKKIDEIAFIESPKSILAESIRSIRTNINFYPINGKCRTILVTSSIPGEGKTFCAINLAASYAQLGKKTVLIGFDLRKPKISEYLHMETDVSGLSRFLVQIENNNLNNHLIEPTIVANLEVIPSGETPPNPVELIASKHTEILFEELKKLYDVIIIDTPPIGLVTDAQLLAKYADINILVTRQNFTPRTILSNLFADGNLKNFKKLSVLFNNVKSDNGGYSQYGGDYYVNK